MIKKTIHMFKDGDRVRLKRDCDYYSSPATKIWRDLPATYRSSPHGTFIEYDKPHRNLHSCMVLSGNRGYYVANSDLEPFGPYSDGLENWV